MISPIETTLQEIHAACSKIESAWRTASNDYFAFPELALQHTEGLDLSALSQVGVLADLLERPEIAKLQQPSSFSDLYYRVFDNQEFFVEVLNWWGSDINIHDHDFSGVQFQVLGASLNVEYKFEESERVDGVDLGTLSVAKAEYWPEGSRHCVTPGRPHNVSHLAEPTVSVLFRTHPGSMYGPQRNYFAPNVAATYPVHDVVWRKRTKMLRLLSSAPDKTEFKRVFREVTSTQTQCENLFTLVKMVDRVFSSDLVSVVQEYAARDDLSGQIARAAAYYRANEVLAKGLKYSCSGSSMETLCMSALSSAFDRNSFDQIHEDLRCDNESFDLWTTLRGMNDRLDEGNARTLASLVNLFGLGEPDLAVGA